MATVTRRNLGANLAAFDYAYNKLFRFNNSTIVGEYTNGTGDEVTLSLGTLMGRNNTSGKFEIFDSTVATSYNGSVGILAEEWVVADGETVTISLVNAGDVRRSGIVLEGNSGADTLDTVVDGNTIEDIIIIRSKGMRLVDVTENTKADN